MPSTNKTPNIGIGQYLPNDVLSWNDINADNALVDTTVGNKLDKTDGGTVTGAVNFTGGLTKNGKNVSTYETGSCDIRFNNATIGYRIKRSNYTIINNTCIVSFYIYCNGTVPSTVSNLVLTGFPVPINTTNESIQPCYMSYLKEPAVSAQTGGVRFTTRTARLVFSLTTSRWSYDATSEYIQDDTVFSGTVIYQI